MKEQIASQGAPAAIGPYSQAIRWKELIFVSGQLALNEHSGQVDGGIREQTHGVLSNLTNILKDSGSGLDCVLKTTVFLSDMSDFADMNDVYSSFFKMDPPARSTIQVAKLPKEAKVEIEAIAFVRK